MKISFYDTKDWEQEYIKKNLDSNLELEFVKEKINKEHLPINTDAEIVSVFVASNLEKEVIEKFPNLKFIATRSTGFDHIDLETAQEKNIQVSNVPSYGEETVAEYAFALLLAVSRKIYLAYDQVRETGSFSQEGLDGFDLRGKTIGIVGTGNIGKNSTRIAHGFGMNILGYDVKQDSSLIKDFNLKYVELEKLLEKSDVVTIHVPYMEATHHLLNEKNIPLMKKGAVLINTSRGPVVETSALVKALVEGSLGGAGLDVLEEEGVIKDEMEFLATGHPSEHDLKTVLEDHVLIDLPNVIVTPHNAFNTTEAMIRILNTTLENIKAFIAGEPKNLVGNKK